MKVFVHTQDRENYGAHSWDGKGECPQYWKFKGGSSFVVGDIEYNTIVELAASGKLEEVVAELILAAGIEEKNEAFETYVLDWELVDDDAIKIVLDDPKDFSASDVEVQRIMYEERDAWEYAGRYVNLTGGAGAIKGWFFERRNK